MLFENPALLLLWIASTYAIVQIFIGWKEHLIASNLEIHKKILARLNEIVHVVEVTKRNDIIYWFDKDSQVFLAQGKNDNEIVSVLKQRFPEHIFYVDGTDHVLCGAYNWEPHLIESNE